MRVIVTGGTGFIGNTLCRRLRSEGHTPVVLSRNAEAARNSLGAGVEAVAWRPGASGPWQSSLEGADAVINLAGESIAARRWSPGQKSAIRESRLEGTRSLVEAMAAADRPPRVLLNASATGYYGPRGSEPVDESTPPGSDFLASVCQAWEQTALVAESLGVRVACVRTGVVLAGRGGALAKMLPPFRLFLGGPFGSGRQGFPWVHLDDVVGIYVWALGAAGVAGPLNATAPELVDNRQFCQTLGRVLGRPCWLPVPGFALRVLLGEMADPLLLQGQKVLPTRTQQLGYQFQFPGLEDALRDLLE
jgi:uncharacterized protein (TIGR01777 family)